MSLASKKLIQASGGAAEAEAAITYVEDVFSTYLYDGNGTAQTINNDIALGNGPANGTVLHLTGDSLADSSPSSKTVTNNNSVSVSTSVKKYGTGSLQFDGVDQYLSIASSADFNFGTNDFTIEGWFYAQSDSDDRGAIFELYASENDMLRVMINTGGVLEFRVQAGGANQMTITTTSWSNNTWHHFAVVNYSGTINCYLDGTSFGSSSSFTIPNLSSAQVLVGLDLFATDRWYTGYIDDLRVTKNRAVYTANFTPPSSAHSLDTQVTGEGGMVWMKNRTFGLGHTLFDTERGSGNQLQPNSTGEAWTYSNSLTSFNSDGFSLGSGEPNKSGDDHVAWTFRKQPGFFDIVTYTGDGTSGRQIAHNLGSTPGMMIVKATSDASGWAVYHRSLGGTKAMLLNTADAPYTSSSYWNDSAPTDSVFTLGSGWNVNGIEFVAYLFAHDAQDFGTDSDESIIKCGSYTGNGSNDGPTIDLGFEPQWLMIKDTTTSGHPWQIIDSMRGIISGGSDSFLKPNASDAESAYDIGSLTATGFKITNNSSWSNTNGNNYIYVAIRRPHKPASEFAATDLFHVESAPFTNSIIGNNFPADFVLYHTSSSSNYKRLTSRLTEEKVLYGDQTSADANEDYVLFDNNKGAEINYPGTLANWHWRVFRRAPGFFDVVTYTGSSSAQEISHSLGVAPELIIQKCRTQSYSWNSWHKDFTNSQYIDLNSDGGVATSSNLWGTNPIVATDSVFRTGSGTTGVDGSTSDKHIAYLFATAPGISKVGTYTGTGSDVNVDCGFSSGARLVIVKRTDGTGDWFVWDTARGIVAGNEPYFRINEFGGDITGTDYIDPLATGFTITSSAPAALNASGGTYLFLAIA